MKALRVDGAPSGGEITRCQIQATCSSASCGRRTRSQQTEQVERAGWEFAVPGAGSR